MSQQYKYRAAYILRNLPEKNTWTQMFTAALFTILRTWK